MAYLEERYPEPPLLPPTPRRGRARGCSSIASTNSRRRLLRVPARRRRTSSRRSSTALEVGAEPVRRHRVRAVGDPRARHARRRAAAAARGAGSTSSRSGRRSPPRSRSCGRCERHRRSTSSRRRLGEVAVVDVRTPHEYDGTLGKPCDPRQGHIPGALNLDVDRLMELDAGRDRRRSSVARAGRRDRRLLPQWLALGDRDADPALARLRRAQLRRLVARVVAPRRAAARDLSASRRFRPRRGTRAEPAPELLPRGQLCVELALELRQRPR